MAIKNRVLFVFSLVAIVLALVAIPVSQASAVDLDISVAQLWTGGTPGYVQWNTSDGLSHSSFVCAGGSDYRTKITVLRVDFGDVSNYVRKGDIFVMSLSGTADNNSNLNIDFARELVDSTGNFEILDIKYSQAGLSAMGVDIYLMAAKNNVSLVNIRRTNGYQWFSMSSAGAGMECMSVGNWAVYRPTGNGSQAIVDAINSNNSTSAINDAKREIVGAIQEQQQTQQDIYNDEKQSMQNDVNNAQNSANSMDSSGFSVSNPWSGWLGLFSDSNCVNIPTIAGWIHSNETQVCSPWQGHANIRPYTTPVVSVLSLTIAFGLVVHWLKGDNDVGLENT